MVDGLYQAIIACHTHHIVHPIVLTPRQNCIATKPRIGPNHYFRCRPVLPDVTNDPRQFRFTAGGSILVRRAQLRVQEVFTTENLQRQIAIIFVIPMIKTLLLTTMQQVIGGIQVQPDFLRRLIKRFDEHIHEQTI